MKFREGWIGAVLDEYERVLTQFKEVIKTLDEDSFKIRLDKETSDGDYVQSISADPLGSGMTVSRCLSMESRTCFVIEGNSRNSNRNTTFESVAISHILDLMRMTFLPSKIV